MHPKQINTKELDAFDLKIIRELGQNARISIVDLSKRIGLSKTPCHNRLRRLEKQGYITGYRVMLDPVKLDLDHIAFVEIKLSSTRANALNEFNAAVKQHPEIEQCHMMASNFDYLLKVRSADIRTYRQFLGETLASLPHVQTSSTHVVMEAVKDDAVLQD